MIAASEGTAATPLLHGSLRRAVFFGGFMRNLFERLHSVAVALQAQGYQIRFEVCLGGQQITLLQTEAPCPSGTLCEELSHDSPMPQR